VLIMALFGTKEGLPEDPYNKIQKMMLGMPREQQMQKIAELMKMCTCPQCPTFNDCAKNAMEGLFCSMGRSFHCISENKGCICPNCPVAKQMGLKNMSFCLMGNEKTQRYDAMLKM
jgi:hypothetical protein